MAIHWGCQVSTNPFPEMLRPDLEKIRKALIDVIGADPCDVVEMEQATVRLACGLTNCGNGNVGFQANESRMQILFR